MDSAAPNIDTAISSVETFPSMSHSTLGPPPRSHDVGEVLVLGDDDQIAFRCDSEHLGISRPPVGRGHGREAIPGTPP